MTRGVSFHHLKEITNVGNGKSPASRYFDINGVKDLLIERRLAERGIGCASIFPAAFIGVAGLDDYAGPTGWRGFSEFLGWAALCVVAGLAVGLLLAQWRQVGWRRYAAVPSAFVAVAAFTYAPYSLGYAPMTAKIVFTTSLQIVGSLTAAGIMLWFGYILWTEYRRS